MGPLTNTGVHDLLPVAEYERMASTSANEKYRLMRSLLCTLDHFNNQKSSQDSKTTKIFQGRLKEDVETGMVVKTVERQPFANRILEVMPVSELKAIYLQASQEHETIVGNRGLAIFGGIIITVVGLILFQVGVEQNFWPYFVGGMLIAGAGGFYASSKRAYDETYTRALTHLHDITIFAEAVTHLQNLPVFAQAQHERTSRTLLEWCELREVRNVENLSVPRNFMIRAPQLCIQPSSVSESTNVSTSTSVLPSVDGTRSVQPEKSNLEQSDLELDDYKPLNG